MVLRGVRVGNVVGWNGEVGVGVCTDTGGGGCRS